MLEKYAATGKILNENKMIRCSREMYGKTNRSIILKRTSIVQDRDECRKYDGSMALESVGIRRDEEKGE